MPESEIQRLLGRIETKIEMLLDGRTEDTKRMISVEDRVQKLESWQLRVVAWCAGALFVLTIVGGVLLKLATLLSK